MMGGSRAGRPSTGCWGTFQHTAGGRSNMAQSATVWMFCQCLPPHYKHLETCFGDNTPILQ